MFRYNSFVLDYQILYYKAYVLNDMWRNYVNGNIRFDDYYNDYNNYYMQLIKFHNWMSIDIRC
jgi:hypothetical protein